MTENNPNCKSTLSEIQDELFDITDRVISICEDNHISYYLAFGSCLGAVRHKNFIPWDDDIDLYICYQDYKKLKDCFTGGGDLFYQDLQTDPEYFLPFAKVRKNGTTSMDVELKSANIHWGICIDLFPLIEYDRPKIRKSTFLKLNLIHKLARIPFVKRFQNLSRGTAALYDIIEKKWRTKLFFKLMDSVQRKGDYCFCPFDDAPECAVFSKDVFGEGKSVPFRKKDFKVPSQYDKYLKESYGPDYMKIPSEDSELRYNHGNSIMDCTKDYSYYK